MVIWTLTWSILSHRVQSLEVVIEEEGMEVVTEEVDLEDRITIHADRHESDKPNSSVERIVGDIFVFTSFLTTNIV